VTKKIKSTSPEMDDKEYEQDIAIALDARAHTGFGVRSSELRGSRPRQVVQSPPSDLSRQGDDMRNVLDVGAAVLNGLCQTRRPDGMPTQSEALPPSSRGSRLAAGALALGGLLYGLPAQAVEFGDGPLRGSLDTTLSHGLTFRVEDRDPELTADVNGNDGNLNYDRGLVSNTSKFTTDLDIDTGDFGVFVRATGFFDFENENGTRERTPLSDAAKDRVASNLDLLDAYVTGTFDVGDTIIDARLGRHVLNWGESTFIPNGINAINPFDVSKLRLPGSELREALLPVGLASISVAPTDALSVEGFYQLDWEKTEIDPVGSYFSSVDYVGPGAERVVIALPGLDLGDMGLTGDDNNPFRIFSRTSVAGAFGAVTAEDPDFLIAPRHADHTPDDSGQWGLALRYLAEELNNTEFGFYYMNYHSRLPLVSAHTGTATDAGAGLVTAGTIGAAGPTAVQDVVTGAVTQAMMMADCSSPLQSPRCIEIAQGVQTETTPRISALAGAAAQAAGIDAYADKGYYFIEYPEDIQLFGVSFNTEIGATGWALQGEWSYRRDAPLQLAERKVFADALGPFSGLRGCIGGKVASGIPQSQAGPACIGENAQAGLYDADTVGHVRRNVSQYQTTATRVFGPTMGADGLVLIGEAAVMHVHGMPQGKGVAATALTPNDMPLESLAGGTLEEGEADADATSWGYRIAARLDYNNAVGGANLHPYTQFLHDVSGNSPSPSGPFVEGRTALTIGLRADYLSRWQADIGYTRYAGDGNELSDRDFISASLKYSF